jgi:transposase
MSESRKYRKFTALQKLEIVLAGLRGDRTVREVCREPQVSETQYYGWRDQLLAAGAQRFAGKNRTRRGGRAVQEGRRARAGPWPQDL